MLGSPQVSRVPNSQIECTSLQRICTGLSKQHELSMLGLRLFLLEHGYVMGSVDKTLFTLNHGTDFLLIQIYVDDIIFGGSSHTLVSIFQKMIESEFHISMMGELTFFLGIQVKQTKQGIFVHQAKYMKDLLKKFNMAELKPVSTLMSSAASLGPDEDGEAVDQREYRSMIGSLLYLTATRSDIQFTMGLCTCFQSSPRSSHWMTVQQIFRCLKHTPEFRICWFF
jgi:hypothetical protein